MKNLKCPKKTVAHLCIFKTIGFKIENLISTKPNALSELFLHFLDSQTQPPRAPISINTKPRNFKTKNMFKAIVPERLNGRERQNEAREIEARVEEVGEESRKGSREGRVVVEHYVGDFFFRSFDESLQRSV